MPDSSWLIVFCSGSENHNRGTLVSLHWVTTLSAGWTPSPLCKENQRKLAYRTRVRQLAERAYMKDHVAPERLLEPGDILVPGSRPSRDLTAHPSLGPGSHFYIPKTNSPFHMWYVKSFLSFTMNRYPHRKKRYGGKRNLKLGLS